MDSRPACTSGGSVRCASCAPAPSITVRTARSMVVDESVGFTGGVGIADEWKGDARNETSGGTRTSAFGARRSTGLRAAFLDNWVETDIDAVRRRDRSFPGAAEARRDSVVQCVRGASEVGSSDVATLFRALSCSGTDLRPHHDRVLRPGRGAHQSGCATPPTGACRCRSCCPGRTPTSAWSSSPAKRSTRGARRTRRRALELPAVDDARQGHDGRRGRRQHRVRQPQRPFHRMRRGDQHRRARPGRWCRSSTNSSTKTSSAAADRARTLGARSLPSASPNGRRRRSAAGSDQVTRATVVP